MKHEVIQLGIIFLCLNTTLYFYFSPVWMLVVLYFCNHFFSLFIRVSIILYLQITVSSLLIPYCEVISWIILKPVVKPHWKNLIATSFLSVNPHKITLKAPLLFSSAATAYKYWISALLLCHTKRNVAYFTQAFRVMKALLQHKRNISFKSDLLTALMKRKFLTFRKYRENLTFFFYFMLSDCQNAE